jgi:hypothetical protein
MEIKNKNKSHPLDLNDSDDDDNKFQNASNFVSTKIPRKRSQLISNNILKQYEGSINFNIEIENVKWLYKSDSENSSNLVTNSDDTSNRWLTFNKMDSTSLEVEYRSFQSRKLFDSNSQPNLIQVFEDLYEVDLLKKKCQAIYWKGE